LLYMATTSAIRYNKTCKDLFERLRKKGKPYKVAVVVNR
jgi:transposase